MTAEPESDYSRFDQYLDPSDNNDNDEFRRILYSHTSQHTKRDDDGDSDDASSFIRGARDTLASVRLTQRELERRERRIKKKNKKNRSLLGDYELMEVSNEQQQQQQQRGKRNRSKSRRREVCARVCGWTCVILLVMCCCLSLLAFVALCVGYVAAGIYAYDEAFRMDISSSKCPSHVTPSNYTQHVGCRYLQETANELFSEYTIPEDRWTEVSFNVSKESSDYGNLVLDGYLLESNFSTDPFVIMVHGIRVCKEIYAVMYPAAILRENGFNVLLLDLRNAGRQQLPKRPFSTFGSREHFDVMGAMDYLMDRFPRTKGSRSIGLFGSSMGGSTALLAFMHERTRAFANALFLDSVVYDIVATLKYNLHSAMYLPGDLLYPSLCVASILIPKSNGCPPFTFDPRTMVRKGSLYKEDDSERFIHFEGTESDRITPPDFNVKTALRDVADTYKDVLDDKLHITSHIGNFGSNANRGDCDDHVQNLLADKAGYRSRIVTFFSKTLRPSD